MVLIPTHDLPRYSPTHDHERVLDMGTINEATKEQQRAVDYLADCYGAASVGLSDSKGVRKITGLDGAGKECARWLVLEDGRIAGAWDPDRHLDGYYAEVKNDLCDCPASLRELGEHARFCAGNRFRTGE